MSDTNMHHLIPRAIAREFSEFLVKIGFQIGADGNILRLPTVLTVNGDAMHLGPHQSYSNNVALLVEQIGQILLLLVPLLMLHV